MKLLSTEVSRRVGTDGPPEEKLTRDVKHTSHTIFRQSIVEGCFSAGRAGSGRRRLLRSGLSAENRLEAIYDTGIFKKDRHTLRIISRDERSKKSRCYYALIEKTMNGNA